MTLDRAALAGVLKALGAPAGAWDAPLAAAMEKYAIDTPKRMAAFLAQIAHESAGLTRLEENLRYSAARIMSVWPSRFPTYADAKPYERNAPKLANKVYADRLGNGSEASGDGWRYRGRGLIQLTGKDNYRAAGEALGLPLLDHPDMAVVPQCAALTAAWFWATRGLNTLADEDTDIAFRKITRRLNGGVVGHDLRRKNWHAARAAMSLTT